MDHDLRGHEAPHADRRLSRRIRRRRTAMGAGANSSRARISAGAFTMEIRLRCRYITEWFDNVPLFAMAVGKTILRRLSGFLPRSDGPMIHEMQVARRAGERLALDWHTHPGWSYYAETHVDMPMPPPQITPDRVREILTR